MEKRIIEAIEKGPEEKAEKLRLIMRAGKVRFSTIDALFHRFLSTEAYVPQVADDHERALITESADARFFQEARVLADIERNVNAARRLRPPPEALLRELDKGREALEAWSCPEDLLDDLKARQVRILAEYEGLQEKVRAVAEATRGTLRTRWSTRCSSRSRRRTSAAPSSSSPT
jgi:coenzyme F420-reducing hydrogenase alpha subunit